MTALPIVRTYTDAEGIDITFYEWPVAAPKGCIQLVHGLGEHGRRYDLVAAALNRAATAFTLTITEVTEQPVYA